MVPSILRILPTGIKVEGTTIIWAPRAEIALSAQKTKTRTARTIPISSRLRAILEMRRFDPAGELLPLETFVFGNAIGQRQKDIKRAWEAAVLKAHGHQPKYTRPTVNLAPESQAALAKVDLHFHDLRREAGSRWLEGGVPLHVVRDWLGHTSIAQTSTYLAGTIKTQHDAMAAFEARRNACNPFATGDETAHHDPPQTAATVDETPNKDAVRHEPTIM